ncbi:MAG TPA: glycosyl hydrolase [Solirubrobacterales bacterium]|nr:glycosyl hydrolase [Solirubrobacterales bacterium]
MRATLAVVVATVIAFGAWSAGAASPASATVSAARVGAGHSRVGALPRGFFGVVPQAPPSATDLTRMEGSVETLRLPIFWSECEPTAGHFDFRGVDAEVGAAAAHGLVVMPFVYGRPAWLGVQNHPPLGGRAMAAWKRFLRVLVGRYGSQGSFWLGRAKRPIRRWQIWNEPNFRLFWAPRIAPRAYAKLLRASARAIHSVDPGAKIVLAGIAPVGAGEKTWVFMRRLLKVPGVRSDFDFAAIHPYSATIPELDYQLERVRGAMDAGGAGGKPIIVTEFGVASSGDYPSAFVVGEAGQAEFLHFAYARLVQMRHRWRIAGAYWYAWQDEAEPDPHCAFCQGAGLFRLDGSPKPSWRAYLRTVHAFRPRSAARAGRPVQ